MSRDELIKMANTLTIDDRAVIASAIWQGIREESQNDKMDREQWDELARRVADYERDPSDVLSWDEVKAKLASGR